MLAVGGAVTAVGQAGWDFDSHCIDPNNTAPYSANFTSYEMSTPWFAGGVGVIGTCTYKYCNFSPSSTAINVQGRMMFSAGIVGSIQDNLRIAAVTDPTSGELNGDPLVVPDDSMRYTWASNTFTDPLAPAIGLTSGAGWSFALIKSGTSSAVFGNSGFSEFFEGSSNRYMYVEETVNSVQVILTMDILGDTARTYWEMTNETNAPVNIGLQFGHYAALVGGALLNASTGYQNLLPQGVGDYGFNNENIETILETFTEEQDIGYLNSKGLFQPYITVPGIKPIETEMRFPETGSTTPGVPAYADFGGGLVNFNNSGNLVQLRPPGQGYGGFQMVNASIPDVQDQNGQSDQTPVDEFEVGDMENLINGLSGSNNTPTINEPLILEDAPLGGGMPTDVAVAQIWKPVSVPAFGTRDIISYYRNIWGDSSYSDGYTAVVDTPKTLSTSANNPARLDPNPFTIQVDVDNTGGYGQTYKQITMTNVQVTLQLPQGLSAVGNPAQNTLVNYINAIGSTDTGSTQFQVQADPTVSGLLPYTVTIQPNPGATKTISGIINVAATPVLLLRQGANLVTCPWNLTDTTWESVLSPLQAELDYTAFSWDPTQQAYIISTTPERGEGTWIVSNSDHGVIALGGSPTTPTDEFPPSTGAPNITLSPGWNLIGDPYNYSFPIGQLVGAVNNGSAETYDQMVSSGVWDGSFAYYVQDNQAYNFLDADTDRMLPNYGYWVHVNEPVTISFPPIFDLFVRTADQTPAFSNYVNHWRLQLAAQGVTMRDASAYVGDTTVLNQATRMIMRKPPMSPEKNAVWTYLSASGAPGQVQYAQQMHGGIGRQTYVYSVYTKTAQGVTISWPNLATLPSNLDVEVKDLTTGTVTNARKALGYAFKSKALGTRSFQVQITPLGTVKETIGSVTETIRNTGSTKQMTIKYDVSSGGMASMYVYKGTKLIDTIVQNKLTTAGTNTVIWPLTLSNGEVISSGNYTLSIKALGEGGDSAIRNVSMSL